MNRRKLPYTLSILILIITISSCNTFKFSDNYTKRKLKRGGLKHHTLEVEDYTFSYWDSGAEDKPVYVLFHGYGTSTHLQLFRQAKMLAKTHRIILPNLLFFGSKPKGEKRYKVQDQVEAMSVLIQELQIDSMVLGGYSYGGVVAAELAMLEDAKVQKLTIFASPVKFFNEGDLITLGTENQVSSPAELLVPSDVDMMRKFTNVVRYKESKIPKFILKDFQENLFQNEETNANLKALLGELQGDMSYFKSRTYTFDYPVLLIWGERDELIPTRIGSDLKEYLGSSELHIIPKAGHGVALEQKKKFNQVLKAFLEK